MNSIVRAELEGVTAGLGEIHERCRRIRVGQIHRRRSGIKFPQNRRGAAWIDNCARKCRTQAADILIRTGINARRARRSRPFCRPGRLNHFEIAHVDRGKIVERR